MESLSNGTESSTITGNVASDINRGACISVIWGKRMNCIKTKSPYYFFCKITYYCLSLDVWGIGPGFDDTATTFSVCTWLNIFYVVGIKTHLQIATSLLFNDDEYFFRGSRTLFGLTACPAMEKLPSAALLVRIFGF